MFEDGDHYTGSRRIDLTPVSATVSAARMAAQQAKYDGWRKAESAARTADAERDATAARALQQGERLNPDAAAAKLAERMKDPEWRDKYLGGDDEARREAAALIEDKTAGSLVDSILDGTALANANASPAGFTTRDGELPVLAQMKMVAGLRDIGVSDDSIRHVLADGQVGAAEHAAAKLAKAQLMKDDAWVARYGKSDPGAMREMTLLNIIIASPIKSAAA